MQKILFSWSCGKDSALALHELKLGGVRDIILLTTVTKDYGRTSMHGVREALLELQAESLGYPLEKAYIAAKSSNESYEKTMRDINLKYKNQGVSTVAFGDIFLEDIRKYREDKLALMDMKALFPLWGRSSEELAHTFIERGFKAIITCVDSQALDKEFAGRIYDEQLLKDLPAGVDPCGESGEFHTFVFDGPIFSKRIPFEKGEIVLRENRFYFCDLI